MALGDIGFMTPAESQFYNREAYDAMLKAESQKQASYLSQMDMFYANLKETKREFDATYKLKEEALDIEHERTDIQRGYLSLEEEKAKIWEEVEKGKLDIAKAQQLMEEKGLDLEAKKLELMGREVEQRGTQFEETLAFQKEEAGTRHEEFESELDFRKWAQEQELNLKGETLDFSKLIEGKTFETKFGTTPELYGAYGQPGGASNFYFKGRSGGKQITPADWGDNTDLAEKYLEASKDVAEKALDTSGLEGLVF